MDVKGAKVGDNFDEEFIRKREEVCRRHLATFKIEPGWRLAAPHVYSRLCSDFTSTHSIPKGTHLFSLELGGTNPIGPLHSRTPIMLTVLAQAALWEGTPLL